MNGRLFRQARSERTEIMPVRSGEWQGGSGREIGLGPGHGWGPGRLPGPLIGPRGQGIIPTISSNSPGLHALMDTLRTFPSEPVASVKALAAFSSSASEMTMRS